MDTIDEPSLWQKIVGVARMAGEAVMLEAMKAWHVTQDPATPTAAKAALYGALAYFVLPTDAIPDILPFVGFGDDMAALGTALYVANAYVTDDIVRRARASVDAIFG